MDIDYLIKTEKFLSVNQILTANKNIRNINDGSKGIIFFEYCGRKMELRCGKKIKVSTITRQVQRVEEGYVEYYYSINVLLVLILDVSNIFKRMLKQVFYDNFSEKFFRNSGYLGCFWFIVLNVIITENDMGIITKRVDDIFCRIHDLEEIVNDVRRRCRFHFVY